MSTNNIQNTDKMRGLQKEALELLKALIAIPSFSMEEDKTATVITSFFFGSRY